MSKLLASLIRNYFPKRSWGTLLHTLSKLYDVPVGFVNPPPHLWGCVLLYLQPPKGGCCSITDDLSCSCNRLDGNTLWHEHIIRRGKSRKYGLCFLYSIRKSIASNCNKYTRSYGGWFVPFRLFVISRRHNEGAITKRRKDESEKTKRRKRKDEKTKRRKRKDEKTKAKRRKDEKTKAKRRKDESEKTKRRKRKDAK